MFLTYNASPFSDVSNTGLGRDYSNTCIGSLAYSAWQAENKKKEQEDLKNQTCVLNQFYSLVDDVVSIAISFHNI